MCPKSCGLCKCSGSHVLQSRCNRAGQAVETRITYRPHPVHHICTTSIEKKKVACEFCPIGQFTVIHECNEASGKRRISHVRAQLVHGPQPQLPNSIKIYKPRCAISVQNELLPCNGCLASESDRKTVLPCRRRAPHPTDSEPVYQLKVITEYMVNEHGCCHVRRSERVFPCDGCPKMLIGTGPCTHGHRLRYFLFFTRPLTAIHNPETKCIPHTVTRKEPCESDGARMQGDSL
ncbi:unnamed protein product [Echinostoma caproni]|uniref:Uncharacterized protein n=1 Tax=Echinostoma caproni TaxID=27848 RepID=A0A3P8I7I9_9TREM|nr:unnamed protein product [Echinostoma caproni]